MGFAQSRSPTAINFGPFGTKRILLKKQEVVALPHRDTELHGEEPSVLQRVILGITRNRRAVHRSDKFLRQHFNFLISELRLVEMRVQPIAPDQFFVSALLNNRAIVNDKDHICPLNRRKTVSDYD